MDRYYAPGLAAAAARGIVRLEGAEAHHLGRVKRARAGARVLLFDGEGLERWAEVREAERRAVTLALLDAPTPGREPAVAVTLAVAPPKGKRMAWLLEKATELAATALIPLVTERGVVDPTARADHKQGKWRQATVEAAKQCGVLRLPRIEEPRGVDEALAAPASARLLLDPGADARPLLEALPERLDGGVVLLIGPEGGFTPEERARAGAAGAVAARLGPTVLRVETAAIAGLATIRCRFA